MTFQLAHVHFGRMYGHPVFRRGICLAIGRHGCDRDSGFPTVFELYKIIETCFIAIAFHTVYNGTALSLMRLRTVQHFNAVIEHWVGSRVESGINQCIRQPQYPPDTETANRIKLRMKIYGVCSLRSMRMGYRQKCR